MTVATNSNAEWEGLCRAIGHPEWIEDERFSSPVGRDAYINERLALVQSVLTGKTTSQWLELMDRNDVPAAPTLKRSEVIEHPQVLASEIIIRTEHPVAGRLRPARGPAPITEAAPAPPPRP